MKSIIIKRLTPELNKDYLDFFDHRAFTDSNPNGPCYCTSPNQDEETIKKMVAEAEQGEETPAEETPAEERKDNDESIE